MTGVIVLIDYVYTHAARSPREAKVQGRHAHKIDETDFSIPVAKQCVGAVDGRTDGVMKIQTNPANTPACSLSSPSTYGLEPTKWRLNPERSMAPMSRCAPRLSC